MKAVYGFVMVVALIATVMIAGCTSAQPTTTTVAPVETQAPVPSINGKFVAPNPAGGQTTIIITTNNINNVIMVEKQVRSVNDRDTRYRAVKVNAGEIYYTVGPDKKTIHITKNGIEENGVQYKRV